MRNVKVAAGVLLPVLLAYLSLIANYFFFGLVSSLDFPLGRFIEILPWILLLSQAFVTPFFMGIVAAFFWHDDPRYHGTWQENLGCTTMALFLLPSMFFTCGITFLLIPLFLVPYWKGVDFGIDFWSRRWREWLNLEVPEVEQRPRRRNGLSTEDDSGAS